MEKRTESMKVPDKDSNLEVEYDTILEKRVSFKLKLWPYSIVLCCFKFFFSRKEEKEEEVETWSN